MVGDPTTFLLYRQAGETRWNPAIPMPSTTTVRDARERARYMTAQGVGVIVAGRTHEWRFYRAGVCVDAWREDGR